MQQPTTFAEGQPLLPATPSHTPFVTVPGVPTPELEPDPLELVPPELVEVVPPELVPVMTLSHCEEQLFSTHVATAFAAVAQSDDCVHALTQSAKPAPQAQALVQSL
jgi:hypothetical protein